MGGQQLYGPGAGLQAMNAAAYANMGMGQRNLYAMNAQNQFMQPNTQQHGQGWPSPQNPNPGAGQWNQQFQ